MANKIASWLANNKHKAMDSFTTVLVNPLMAWNFLIKVLRGREIFRLACP